MIIGQRIKLLRNRLKLNQTEFAAPLNISQEAISAIEKTGNVTIENLTNISNVYKVSMDWLIKGVEGQENGTRKYIEVEVQEINNNLKLLHEKIENIDIIQSRMIVGLMRLMDQPIQGVPKNEKEEIKKIFSSD